MDVIRLDRNFEISNVSVFKENNEYYLDITATYFTECGHKMELHMPKVCFLKPDFVRIKIGDYEDYIGLLKPSYFLETGCACLELIDDDIRIESNKESTKHSIKYAIKDLYNSDAHDTKIIRLRKTNNEKPYILVK